MIKIRRLALLSALEGAKNLYPDEFIALFRGEETKGADGRGSLLLTDLILAPFSTYDADSSSYSPYFIPANTSEKASFHSHPSPNSAFPSRQDVRYFSHTGGVHFIACHPFGIRDVNCFGSKGKPVEFKIV